MKLKDWLDKNGVTEVDFAKKIGTSYMSVNRYVNDKRIPRKPVMKKIFNKTDGQVTSADFYGGK